MMKEVDMLLEGNWRFVSKTDPGHFKHMKTGQQPFAVVVTCSDSRVCPEIIFDQWLGKVFVVRTAGNVIMEPTALGSIEYAVKHLGVPLLVIMGHTECGAIKALFEKEPKGHMGTVLRHIFPAKENVPDGAENIEEAVTIENIKLQMDELKSRSGIVRERLRSGGLTIVGMLYDMDDGRVCLIE